MDDERIGQTVIRLHKQTNAFLSLFHKFF